LKANGVTEMGVGNALGHLVENEREGVIIEGDGRNQKFLTGRKKRQVVSSGDKRVSEGD